MGQQRNASNQSYGGGSSDYAVIAPYIESPSPFERMGGRQRASGGSSSGKNPFEDILKIEFDNPNADGMYSGEAIDISSAYTAINIAEKALQNSALQMLMTSDAETATKIISEYYMTMGDLNLKKRELDAQKKEAQSKFAGNEALVRANPNETYYDTWGRPVVLSAKTKDGDVKYNATYSDMHKLNIGKGLNETFRLDAPIDNTLLVKKAREYAKSVNATKDEFRVIDYQIRNQDMSYWKTSSASSNMVSQQIQSMADNLRIEARSDKELQRALTASFIRTFENPEEWQSLSEKEFNTRYNTWEEAFVKGISTGAVKERVDGSYLEERMSQDEFFQKMFNTDLSKLSDFDAAYLGNKAGLEFRDMSKGASVFLKDVIKPSVNGVGVIDKLFPANVRTYGFNIGEGNVKAFNEKAGTNLRAGGSLNSIFPNSDGVIFIANNEGGGYSPTKMNSSWLKSDIISLNSGKAFYAPGFYTVKQDGVDVPTTDKSLYLTDAAQREWDNPMSLGDKADFAKKAKYGYVVKELVNRAQQDYGKENVSFNEATSELSIIDPKSKQEKVYVINNEGNEVDVKSKDITSIKLSSGTGGTNLYSPYTFNLSNTTFFDPNKIKDAIKLARSKYIEDYLKNEGGVSTSSKASLKVGKIDKLEKPEGQWYLPFNVRVNDGSYDMVTYDKKIKQSNIDSSNIGRIQKGKDPQGNKVDYRFIEMYLPIDDGRMKDFLSDDANALLVNTNVEAKKKQDIIQDMARKALGDNFIE